MYAINFHALTILITYKTLVSDALKPWDILILELSSTVVHAIDDRGYVTWIPMSLNFFNQRG